MEAYDEGLGGMIEWQLDRASMALLSRLCKDINRHVVSQHGSLSRVFTDCAIDASSFSRLRSLNATSKDLYALYFAPHLHSVLLILPLHPFYERGFSFFSFHSAARPTPDTFTTLNRTPGISPLALPFRPNPDNRTSSFSSTKLRQPSLGTVLH